MNSSMRGGVVLHGLLLLYNHFTTFDLFSLLQTAERRTFHKLIMAQVSSLRELAFASLASLLQRSMTHVAADQKLILDFTNYEIVDDKMDDFETFIQSEEARTIMKYYKPIRRILVTSDLKKIYETLFKSSWSHGLKNSWLWFFYQNMESEHLDYTFYSDTKEMDLLKYQFIAGKENSLVYCKIMKFHHLPLWNLSDEEFKVHQIKMLNFLDKLPALEDFCVRSVPRCCNDKELKFRLMMAVSNFTSLKTLRLPPLDEDDCENFKRFLKWAPKTIQSLCLEFKTLDFAPASINLLDDMFKSVANFKKLVSLEWIMSFKPMDTHMVVYYEEMLNLISKESAKLLKIVDALDENEEKIHWVTRISITSGRMFVLRLIDKRFKNVKQLELIKFFNEPILFEGIPITQNLKSVQHLNVHGNSYVTHRHGINNPNNPLLQYEVKISVILNLFPNLKELTIPCLSLQTDEKFEDIPEAGFLEKLLITLGIVTPPNLITKMPNLKHLILYGKEDSTELDQHLPKKCVVFLKPFSN